MTVVIGVAVAWTLWWAGFVIGIATERRDAIRRSSQSKRANTQEAENG